MGILEILAAGQGCLVTGGAGLTGGDRGRRGRGRRGPRTLRRATSEPLEAWRRTPGQGLDVRARQFDQGDEASILALRDAIMQDSRPLDVLVNNAVLAPDEERLPGRRSDVRREHAGQRHRAFHDHPAFGDVMAEQGSGSIINIGSIQGMIGPDPTIYRGTDHERLVPGLLLPQGRMINFTRFIASYYGARACAATA